MSVSEAQILQMAGMPLAVPWTAGIEAAKRLPLAHILTGVPGMATLAAGSRDLPIQSVGAGWPAVEGLTSGSVPPSHG